MMRACTLLLSILLIAMTACGGCEDETSAVPSGAFDSEPCTQDSDCLGVCGGAGVCTGGGTTGFDGETCSADTDCRGTCNDQNVCEGAGTGEQGTSCETSEDCLGECVETTNTCSVPPAGFNNTVTNNALNNPTGLELCNGPCACDNGIDDDGDGLVDGFDPECTGPYDDDEGSFATGIPGDNIDFCQDCFFDGNSGSGDDKCQYNTECLYGNEPTGGGNSACFKCEVSQECEDNCRPRTPNGCDCFGCCEVETNTGEKVLVFLQESCSLDRIDDTDACPRCVQAAECLNECGRCELCPGKGIDDLPADCGSDPDPDPDPTGDMGTTTGDDMGTTTGDDMGNTTGDDMGNTTPDEDMGSGGGDDPVFTCDDGEQVCTSSSDCPANFYCQQGCCLEIFL